MKRSGFSLIQLLTVTAIVATLTGAVFPALVQSHKSKITNKPNLQKVSLAAIAYGADSDEHIPILMNGPSSDLVNASDGSLTMRGRRRTDNWPLILLPYVKDRSVYQDPRRDDTLHIWSSPAHASSDSGYDPYRSTYRNQNRYPCFGVNYVFLSPMVMKEESDGAVGTSKTFTQATDPANTIFYCVSMRGGVPTGAGDSPPYYDTVRGFYVVNAPGMFGLSSLSEETVILITGAPCSGDWCGDADTKTPGKQASTNFAYIERVLKGNNTAFLDGHVKFMTPKQMTAGTNYDDAVPNGEDNQSGAVITDKKKYLWDLDGDFYGLYK